MSFKRETRQLQMQRTSQTLENAPTLQERQSIIHPPYLWLWVIFGWHCNSHWDEVSGSSSHIAEACLCQQDIQTWNWLDGNHISWDFATHSDLTALIRSTNYACGFVLSTVCSTLAENIAPGCASDGVAPTCSWPCEWQKTKFVEQIVCCNNFNMMHASAILAIPPQNSMEVAYVVSQSHLCQCS